MKTLFFALLSVIALCATDVKAEPFPGNIRNPSDPIVWKFTALTDGSPTIHSPGMVDYSHELQQRVAVSLPPAMLKKGWSCVRDAMDNDNDGGFTCSNGDVEISNHVNCYDTNTQRNEMKVWDIKKSHDAPYGAMFMLVAECSR